MLKRNRTTASKREERDLLEQSRTMRARERLAVFVLVIVCAVLAVAASTALLWRPELRIRHVRVTGVAEVSADEVVVRVRDMLLGRVWGFIPADSLIFARIGAVALAVGGSHSWIDDVAIGRTATGVLHVAVREYKPAFLSCLGLSCYYVTGDGFRFAPAPLFHGGPYIELEGGTTTVREYVLPRERFARFVRVFDGLPLPYAESRIMRVRFTDDGDYIAIADRAYEVRWDDDARASQLHARLTAAYATAPLAGILVAAPDTLEYIDARFGKKIFYKFTDETNGALEE